MKAIPVILCMAMLLLVACAPKPPEQPSQPVAPVQPAEPVAVAPPTQPEPTPAARPVLQPTAIEMDAATQARLDSRFGPGVKLALSDTFIRMKIGESKVIGIGMRSLETDQDDYQVRFSLKNAYDKSRSIITSEFRQIQPWMVRNMEGPVNGFAIVTLANKSEKRYPFLIEVKPTFDDGTATQVGTYEIEVKVFRRSNRAGVSQEYALQLLTLLVEQ